MSSSHIEALEPGRWRISGQLTLGTVAALAAEGKRLAAAGSKTAGGDGPDVQIDLAGVEQGSSAGVALLLELQQQMLQAGGQLRLRNVPEALARIAEFSNVDGLLGIRADRSDATDPMHPLAPPSI